MERITLQNYRCFGPGTQTARLAPLTLLVGPNGTGKTSFLALVRALWDVAFDNRVPDFREAPYDLGSFQDIIHQRGGRSKNADRFAAGFEFCPPMKLFDGAARFDATFADLRAAPCPVVRHFTGAGVTFELPRFGEEIPGEVKWRRGNDKGTIKLLPSPFWPRNAELIPVQALSFPAAAENSAVIVDGIDGTHRTIEGASLLISNEFSFYREKVTRPVASAPVQSRPLRTYDPVQLAPNPYGASVPSYLASLYRSNPDEWEWLKVFLDKFGKASGLFDEITVKSFGKSDGDPFQLQVRKSGKKRKGPWRNLIDAGYGVSQALPLIVELLKPPNRPASEVLDYTRPALLLQQPEVHLHPQAEAELGTLLGSMASVGRQIIVETHSDYIIDRVRMDVRDGISDLKPEDVSILYFEPGDLEVKIHNIRLDQMGNVLDAPPGYRQFFMAEQRRSIGF